MSDFFSDAFRRKSRRPRTARRKGFVLVAGVLMLLMVVIPAAGLAVDVGLMYLTQSKLSAAADFGSVAGARALSRGVDDAAQRSNAEATARIYFSANFPTGYLATKNLVVTSTAAIDSTYMRSVTTNASLDLPFIFMRVFGLSQTHLQAAAKATRRDVNVMIIMDRSKSLADSGSCAPLKAAAVNFVEKFAEGRDNLGLLTFATSSRVDYAMATTFKTPVESKLNSVVCTGGTSSAQALWQGYQQLVGLNQSGALNVLVFFTDGRPTAVTETFPIRGTSGCRDRNAKVGVLTVGFSGATPTDPLGLYLQDAPPLPVTSDVTLISNRTDCRFASTPSQVDSDVSYAPTTDYWGNSLTATAYHTTQTSGAGLDITHPANIQNFTVNAADHAGLRVRRGDPDPSHANRSIEGVLVYTIGLGDVDDVLLRRIANDPALVPNPVAAGSQGRYVYAQNANELDLAFTRVASELLRIAK